MPRKFEDHKHKYVLNFGSCSSHLDMHTKWQDLLIELPELQENGKLVPHASAVDGSFAIRVEFPNLNIEEICVYLVRLKERGVSVNPEIFIEN